MLPLEVRLRALVEVRLRGCSICVWSSDGSSRAITWPFFTIELKSAPSSWTMPDTWLPTCTVVTACSVPVAPTVIDDVAAGDRQRRDLRISVRRAAM